MKCPYCGNDETKVIDKRNVASSIRRRRECLKCKKRFTTYERIELQPLIVIKRDGRREPFDRNKLKSGILKACTKRPINMEKIDSIVNYIESKLRSLGKDEIHSKKIGQLVMERLKKLDEVAYIRFASVYKKFKDVSQFEKEAKGLKKHG